MQAVTKQQAAAELLNIYDAEEHLLSFTKYTFPQFEPAEHHNVVAEALEAVARGDIDRLILEAPPRHTKSELASRRLPAWFLGHNPEMQVVGCSYNSELASDFGRDVRNIVNDPSYQMVFPGVELRADSKAANRWHTNHGGMYTAAGVGTALTGRGFHLGIIDDPFKDRIEADSERRRQVVWDWYRSVFTTRMMPGARRIVMCTRWHEDDLVGRILDSEADNWHRVTLPAISDEGTDKEQALWPEWYPLKSLHEIRHTIGVREWNALYQQSPTAEEGIHFKREWFRRYDPAKIPEIVDTSNNYLAGDYALTPDGGDYTEIANWSTPNDGDLYATGWWNGQVECLDWCETLIDFVDRYKPLRHVAESGQIRRATEPLIKRRMRERKSYCALEWLPANQNKLANARSFQAFASQGRVWIPDNVWGERVISNLLSFPGGVYDDVVDNCGLIGRFLDQLWEKEKPAQKEKTLAEAWNEQPTMRDIFKHG